MMITALEIENYKSIQKLSLSPGRVNIFIGKPASGKSNIIEAIALLSRRNVPIKELVRMKEYNDLIYDRDIEKKLTVEIDKECFQMTYKNGDYHILYSDERTIGNYKKIHEQRQTPSKTFTGSDGKILEPAYIKKYELVSNYINNKFSLEYLINSAQEMHTVISNYLSENIFYYKFKLASEFNDKTTERLNAPFGNNLPQIILTRGTLRKIITEILSDYDLKLGLNPNENTIKIIKELDGVIYDYPFVSLSDSLQRLIFYITAMHTENSTLLFEEPESHIFPFYNKYLGEKIALDESNQYFIATHSFPFLSSILQKTIPEDLRIYITYYEDYQTRVFNFPEGKFSDVFEMESSFFLNLDNYTEE